MSATPASAPLSSIRPAPAWGLHGLALAAPFFLYIYSRVVCPFMDSLSAGHLAGGLAIVTVLHMAMRLAGERWWPPAPGTSAARHGFHLAVLTWGLAGVAAVVVHAVRYPDFPFGSHAKLLTGYWVLGGGMAAQLEYALRERSARRLGAALDQARAVHDRLGRRLMEGFFVFTVAPAAAMVLLVERYVHEGYADRVVLGEVFFLAVVLTGGALAVAAYYGRTLREDTQAIVHALEGIAAGRLEVALPVARPDELGRVAVGINDMAGGLRQRERIREAFGRFVSPAVAEAFLREYAPLDGSGGGPVRLGGKRREVTVLLTDLRDFTPLAATLPPEELTDLLNAYFTAMVAVVQAHGGLVDKFMGDALMAVFGAVEDEAPEDAAVRAVRCAQAMGAALAAFNAARPGHPPLIQGSGIATGAVVAGYFGSPERLEFTVIGATVNLAARLQAEARAPRPPILLDGETARRVGTILPLMPVGTAGLKGVDGPVSLHAPVNAVS